MASEIHQGPVPLAVLSVDRRFNHDGAMISGAGERLGEVGYPHPNDLRNSARFRSAPVTADVGDDHGSVIPDGHWRDDVANPRPLDEAEGGGKEGHGTRTSG